MSRVKVDKPVWMDKATILCTTVGSEVHGVTHGDDHDEMAVFVEPPEYMIGLDEFKTYMYRTAWERTGKTAFTLDQPRSQEGDTDHTAYSLGKFFSLLWNGNPSICVPLWTPKDQVLKMTPYGQMLIDYCRKMVWNKRTIKKFIGYANGQRHRLEGTQGQKNVKRPELEEAYGYDTKYAYHILRLLIQADELLWFGEVCLPMQSYHRDALMDVRTGKKPVEWVYFEADRRLKNLERDMENARHIPDNPDRASANEYITRFYLSAWKEIYGI